MKKILILGSTLFLLSSMTASAQIFLQFGDEYPRGNEWNRYNKRDYYWQQVRLNEEAEARAQQEAHNREFRDYPDNGHRYAYGKGHQKPHGHSAPNRNHRHPDNH